MADKPIAAGKSSFSLIKSSQLFSEIGLVENITMLDLACGVGTYAMAASSHVGSSGKIIAVDLWKDGIDTLKAEIQTRKIDNIFPHVADVSQHIPMADHSVDICLMATVLHDLVQDNTDQGTLKEVQRTLKPNGRLAVIEFKKKDGPPGPPRIIRLSSKTLETFLRPFKFLPDKTVDMGDHLYLSIYYKS
ncbi:MAG: methyltransferase domain-containing protein [Desulfobacterales bacterium]|nr:methyltransferase domain-containing protein [Desulfobacterales bacterium]MDX2512220.1 methyltransferase domain-containing protein [Desulfobacterales bacterium]